jgi:hypothetical protein
MKAISIIRIAAEGDDTDALGFKYWLKEWHEKN